jgi:hypothetical protein
MIDQPGSFHQRDQSSQVTKNSSSFSHYESQSLITGPDGEHMYFDYGKGDKVVCIYKELHDIYQ